MLSSDPGLQPLIRIYAAGEAVAVGRRYEERDQGRLRRIGQDREGVVFARRGAIDERAKLRRIPA